MANSPQLQTAIRAALKAGKIISRESGNVDSLEVHEKTQFDFFSRVDTECQETIYGILKAAFPRDGFVAEENGVAEHTDAECVWYIDPLDGTTNFLHGFPQYAVSIGMTYRGKLTIGVVYDPSRNELFYAEKGKGAFMNDARIRVSGRSDFSQALIGTGFPFRKTDDYASFMPKFERVARAAAGLRRAGSAALDLLGCLRPHGRLLGIQPEKLGSRRGRPDRSRSRRSRHRHEGRRRLLGIGLHLRRYPQDFRSAHRQSGRHQVIQVSEPCLIQSWLFFPADKASTTLSASFLFPRNFADD